MTITELVPERKTTLPANFPRWGVARISSFHRNVRLRGRSGQPKRAQSVELNPMGAGILTPIRREQLVSARYIHPSKIELVFADDTLQCLPIERLGIPIDRIRWNTAKAESTGECLTVITTNGEAIPIDSATLRYLVDPVYAAEVSKSLNEIRLTRDEMSELSEPPTGWAR